MKTPTKETLLPFIQHGKGIYSPTSVSGKWCIFVSEADVDTLWNRLCILVDEGTLPVILASTKLSMKADDSFVVCVFSLANQRDIWKTRGILRQAGVVQPLKYKLDDATLKGIYDCEEEWLIDETKLCVRIDALLS